MSAVYAARLTVYRDALGLVLVLDACARELPREWEHLARQLRRAATAVVLNIAEGADEFKKAEKARIYRIARREASECRANLDITDLVLPNNPRVADARTRVTRLLHDISALIGSVERRRE